MIQYLCILSILIILIDAVKHLIESYKVLETDGDQYNLVCFLAIFSTIIFIFSILKHMIVLL